MKQTRYFKKAMLGGGLALAALALGACSDSDDPVRSQQTFEFEIQVSNLTLGQPFSPLALIAHHEDWRAFETGSAASVALEELAEGGDNSGLLQSASAEAGVYSTVSGAGIVAPGSSETITLEVNAATLGTLSLSMLSMLVNTNDAIVALNAQTLNALAVDESMSWSLNTYDTGTEANTETADTVPGPAAAGGLREGFNANRDDVRDAVYVHAGVVTQEDGLSSSDLSFEHRWDHPAARLTVTRLR